MLKLLETEQPRASIIFVERKRWAENLYRDLRQTIKGVSMMHGDLPQGMRTKIMQAFRDGRPTAAAEGFARRCGVDPATLEVRETEKGPFVFATIRQSGRPTADLLGELAPEWIRGLQGRRFMRWGRGESRFSRPVRWLTALLDGEVIPVRLPDCDPPISSGRVSRGHRLHPEAKIGRAHV